MTIYVIHYIDGDHDIIEAERHTRDDKVYLFLDVANNEGRYVEIEVPITSILSIRKEMEEEL